MMRRPITATIPGRSGQPGGRVIGAGPRVHQRQQERPSRRRTGLIDATTGEIVWTTEGLANRLAQGVVNPETSEGFHGLVAFDTNGDGIADFSTWIDVGPDGEVPLVAQLSGPACRGLTNLFLYFTVCTGS